MYLLSTEISCDPKVRKYIRNEFYEAATISTTPTEVGKLEIDSRHPFRHLKRLSEKPVKLFVDTQFAELRSAEKEGLIKISISIPENTHQKLLKKLAEIYCTNSRRENSKEWNDLRRKILETSLKDKLYPIFQKSLYQKLLSEAKDRVLSLCYSNLKALCNTGPFEMKAGRVMTAICGATNRDPVVCATIDYEGELINTIRIPNLLFKKFTGESNNNRGGPQDFSNEFDPVAKAKLREFMEETKPKVIVIAANNIEARKLMGSLSALLDEIQSRYEQIATAIWGVIDVPRICSLTPEYEKEFTDYNSQEKLAISLARYLRDPITQIALLFHREEDIYALNLHPFQSIIDKETFANNVQRSLIDSVNQIGVDINRIIDHPFRSVTLNFICGLGPRKAAHLKQRITKASFKLNSRQDLNDYLETKVYKNAAGFLRVGEQYLLGDNAEYFFELDDTRIHPNDYNYAVRMIRDALNESGSNNRYSRSDSFDDSTRKKIVSKFFAKGKNRAEYLRKINISQSLRDLDPEGKIKIEKKLMDIKDELLEPFKDPRHGYTQPDPDTIFIHLTGESIEVGQIITVTITSISPSRALTRLESGLIGVIEKDKISDSGRDRLLSIGQVVNCRVLGIDKVKYEVSLSCKGSDLHADNNVDLGNDPYLLPDEVEVAPKRVKPKRDPVAKTRIIVHPLFKNITFMQAEEELQNATSGEVIFRPSSKGTNHLTLTYKFHDVVAHVDINEEDKPNALALGRTLKINEEVYEDLNEIVARFIEPIIMYSDEMRKFRRFLEDNDEKIENILKAEKEASPHSIPYRICVSHECPGRYKLLYLPNRNIKREFISCTQNGFKFRQSYFKSPEELISWFKNHWREVPSKNPSKIDSSVAISNNNQTNLSLNPSNNNSNLNRNENRPINSNPPNINQNNNFNDDYNRREIILIKEDHHNNHLEEIPPIIMLLLQIIIIINQIIIKVNLGKIHKIINRIFNEIPRSILLLLIILLLFLIKVIAPPNHGVLLVQMLSQILLLLLVIITHVIWEEI